MTRLVLCRHAELGNREESKSLARALETAALAAVYTSPLRRAVETARAIADVHELVPVEVDDLREIDFGEVGGLGFDELPGELRAALLTKPLAVHFPGGETYADLRKRVEHAVDALVRRHRGETFAAVTHAGAIRAALATWLHIGDEALFRIDQRYGAVNVVDWIDGVPLVRLVNGARPSG